MIHTGAGILELVDFISRHFPENKGRERDLEKVVKKVIEYNTGDYGRDDKGIIYTVRINMNESGESADVYDLAIREDHRGSPRLIKYIIGRNWSRFPCLKTIRFTREGHSPENHKTYRLIRFFRKGVRNGRGNKERDSSAYAAGGAYSG